MRVCFLAERTCALTVNGAYLGLIDGFERTVELAPSDEVFCNITPCGDYLPFGFRLDEAFLCAPPPQIRLYYTENAVAVYCCDFLRADRSLKVLCQERFRDARLTLILQGEVQLNFQTETNFQIIPLPNAFEHCTMEETAAGFLLRCENAFALLSREGKVLILSEGRVISAEETLKAEIPFHDSLGHTAMCEWRGDTLISCAIRTSFEPNEATFVLALFESALIGADCTLFLADSLKEKAGVLKEYLGDYRSVVLTDEHDKIGLVFARRERVFDVKYYRIELQDGKIANIKPIQKSL